jgi:hypothetical protein
MEPQRGGRTSVTPPRRNQPNDSTQRTAARLLAIAPRIEAA